jgi:hypothetical protein
MRKVRILILIALAVGVARASSATVITFDALANVTNNLQAGSTFDAQGVHISTLTSVPATVDGIGDTFTATLLSDTFWLISNPGGDGSVSPLNFAAATNGGLNEVLFSFSTPITSLSLQTDSTFGESPEIVRLFALQLIGPNLYQVIAVAEGLDNATAFPANFLQVTGGAFSFALFQTTTEQEGFDNLTFTPIPEPATLGLLCTGLAGLAGRRWRKSRSSR